jgi:hypothetical protein
MAEVHRNRTDPGALHPNTGFEDQEAHQAPWHFRLKVIVARKRMGFKHDNGQGVYSVQEKAEVRVKIGVIKI